MRIRIWPTILHARGRGRTSLPQLGSQQSAPGIFVAHYTEAVTFQNRMVISQTTRTQPSREAEAKVESSY